MPIKIVTDSACDLPEDMVAQYGITVVPLYINLANRGYLDGIEITREEFYRQLPDYNPPPTTAAPGPEKFCQVYEGLAAQMTLLVEGAIVSEQMKRHGGASQHAKQVAEILIDTYQKKSVI